MIKMICTKSPKDLNMNNPERSSGQKQIRTGNPDRPSCQSGRVEYNDMPILI